MSYFVYFLGLISLVICSVQASCSCGFVDPSSKDIFTEFIIVYFNETNAVPQDIFSVQSYEDGYEKSWNARYRNGADVSNVEIGGSQPSSFGANSSLGLFVDPSTSKHLVMGGGIKTLRSDIQYGTFRSFIRPSQPWVGGSAMSMFLSYNDTQSIQMSTMNTDKPDSAWINMLLADEFPDRNLGVNYTVIQNSTIYNQTTSPWDFTELRVDWTKEKVDYYIGNALARSATLKNLTREKFPSTPSPLILKHWSDGDPYYMGGPPQNRTMGNIGWTRAFFNSSLMTKSQHEEFDSRCQISDACSIEDMALRGYSSFSEKATLRFKLEGPRSVIRVFAFAVLSSFVAITVLLLINIIYQRIPPEVGSSAFSSGSATLASTPVNLTRPSSVDMEKEIDDVKVTKMRSARLDSITDKDSIKSLKKKDLTAAEVKETADMDKKPTATGSIAPLAAPHQPLVPKKRVDYLAGLISFSTLIVTLIHFSFTFVPAVGMPGEPHHYRSEVWANKIIAPFLLNQIVVGVFFITSTRFLIEKYLKGGDLLQIAEKTTGRTFRVIIPVAAIAMLEYFLVDCGAIKWLEYLPSVTWSTWPYAVAYTDFAHFLDEVLELIYLIPNAAPQITYNYCTGVLWTIPVQLQGSWLTLLGALVIYEIKTPWKRAGCYAVCIINHWYAQSWGTFFWFGIMFADLDVTYQYKKLLSSHKLILNPFLWIATIFAIGGLANDLVTSWTGFALPIVEHGIHPDELTGLPIAQTSNAGYPDYFAPRLNGLIFSVGLQALIEVSPFVQKIFSAKIFLVIFPHIFTIYLIHGITFWSIGALICVHLNAAGWPYWAVILVVGLVCYTILFACLPLLTPVVETLGKNVTANIWQWAHVIPYPKRKTLFPFREDLFFEREERKEEEEQRIEKGKGVEKGNGDVQVEDV